MGQQLSSLSGFFVEPGDTLETLLLVASILVVLGYLALRYSRRLRLPVVTAFLLLGIVVGPSGLDLVDSSMMNSLRIIEPVALGMIAFAAGEQLRFCDLASLSVRHRAAIVLETVLPVVLVAAGAYLLTRRIEVALPIGAIAGTTGLATVISTLKESGAKGDFTKILGAAVATDNVFAVLFFSLTLPLVVAIEKGGSLGSLYVEGMVGIVASIVIGLLGGLLVSRFVRTVRSAGELSMLGLASVLLVAAINAYLGFSVLLAGLAMGAAAANLTKDEKDRDRVFAALGPLEYPIFAIFFLYAGASLHLRALGGIGWIFAVYLIGRAAGKLLGPVMAAARLKWSSAAAVQFRSLGVGLLPQAGAAVGLAVIVRDSVPITGDLILATVLAAVVIFELVGPLGVQWATRRAGEVREWSSIHPLTLSEAVKELESRKARVVVLRQSSGPLPDLEPAKKMAAGLHGMLVEIPVTAGVATIAVTKTDRAASGGTKTDGAATGMTPRRIKAPMEVPIEPADMAQFDGAPLGPAQDGVPSGRRPDKQSANGRSATDPSTDGRPAGGETTGDQATVAHPELILDSTHVNGCLDTIVELKPHVLFIALPRKTRQLLGPADALSSRLGCPVVDLPTARNRHWVDTMSSRLADADETLERLSARWKSEWRPKIESQLNERRKQP